MRDGREDELRDMLYDAFMTYWRGAESEQAVLWAVYSEAQANSRYMYKLGPPLSPVSQKLLLPWPKFLSLLFRWLYNSFSKDGKQSFY
jgi:hypothetical protein